MNIRHQLILGTLGSALLAAAVSTTAAPNSITDKGSVSQKASVAANKQKINTEQIKINGLQGGKITTKGNKIIVQGGTIVSKAGDKEPAIRIDNPKNKQILIQNTRILSDGVTQNNKNGSAGIVVIENNQKQGNNQSRVQIDNVRVEARNSTIRAQSSSGGSACAGVVCTGFGDDDDSDMVVNIRGNNTFEAISK
ncbi:hypothetical protein LVJ83_08675 [Uruburuella testudinis]|uniref:Uncharacterized protein n=1 Tax=Uruburuella testudinis TaxID=1282863 RepID=A0ABY4DQ06_9NEIS|nr:hypothetical protein [Uruburuella testudinis]UOO81053.1 hypothetical protein LVJ83_08675 [Uruburuella testudinis]